MKTSGFLLGVLKLVIECLLLIGFSLSFSLLLLLGSLDLGFLLIILDEVIKIGIFELSLLSVSTLEIIKCLLSGFHVSLQCLEGFLMSLDIINVFLFFVFLNFLGGSFLSILPLKISLVVSFDLLFKSFDFGVSAEELLFFFF